MTVEPYKNNSWQKVVNVDNIDPLSEGIYTHSDFIILDLSRVSNLHKIWLNNTVQHLIIKSINFGKDVSGGGFGNINQQAISSLHTLEFKSSLEVSSIKNLQELTNLKTLIFHQHIPTEVFKQFL